MYCPGAFAVSSMAWRTRFHIGYSCFSRNVNRDFRGIPTWFFEDFGEWLIAIFSARYGGVDVFLDKPRLLGLGSYGTRWGSSTPVIL